MYECKYYIPNPLLLLLFVPLGFGIYLLCNINNSFVASKSKLIVLGAVSVLASVTMISLFAVDYVSKYNGIYRKYADGNYETVIGEVHDLSAQPFFGNGGDVFSVGDVDFSLGNSMSPGYSKLACHHGLVNQNGITVEIRYVSYNNEKCIMYISVLDP